jgi:hypothetical protein
VWLRIEACQDAWADGSTSRYFTSVAWWSLFPDVRGRVEVWARTSGRPELGGAFRVIGRAKPVWYVEGRDAPAGRSDALVRSALARKERISGGWVHDVLV